MIDFFVELDLNFDRYWFNIIYLFFPSRDSVVSRVVVNDRTEEKHTCAKKKKINHNIYLPSSGLTEKIDIKVHVANVYR